MRRVFEAAGLVRLAAVWFALGVVLAVALAR